MIRLALVGCSKVSLYESLAPRLSGALIARAVEPDSSGELAQTDLEACDAVIIEAHRALRVPLALQAVEARRHVLVAAPLCATPDDAERLSAAVREAGVCLVTGRRKRFLPGVATIKESLVSGKLGALGLLRVHRWAPWTSASTRDEDVALEAIVEEADLARWLFDSAPTVVQAAGRKLGEGYYLQAHLGFPGGGMALIDCAPLPARSRAYFSCSAIGARGAAYADDHHNAHLVFRDGEPTALISDQESAALLGLLEEFLQTATSGPASAITAGEERELIEISSAIRRSASGEGPMLLRGGGNYEPTE